MCTLFRPVQTKSFHSLTSSVFWCVAAQLDGYVNRWISDGGTFGQRRLIAPGIGHKMAATTEQPRVTKRQHDVTEVDQCAGGIPA